MKEITIGVLALQGDIVEHEQALKSCGVNTLAVRNANDLAKVDAIVLPGGESTTIEKLLKLFDLFEPLKSRLQAGLPAFGSCAGMILLANKILDGEADQESLGQINMTVRRNAFGRQVNSAEIELSNTAFHTEAITAVFIRAPWVESVGENVQVLARIPDSEFPEGRIVAVRQNNILAASFHPELCADKHVHEYFVNMVKMSLSEKGV